MIKCTLPPVQGGELPRGVGDLPPSELITWSSWSARIGKVNRVKYVRLDQSFMATVRVGTHARSGNGGNCSLDLVVHDDNHGHISDVCNSALVAFLSALEKGSAAYPRAGSQQLGPESACHAGKGAGTGSGCHRPFVAGV